MSRSDRGIDRTLQVDRSARQSLGIDSPETDFQELGTAFRKFLVILRLLDTASICFQQVCLDLEFENVLVGQVFRQHATGELAVSFVVRLTTPRRHAVKGRRASQAETKLLAGDGERVTADRMGSESTKIGTAGVEVDIDRYLAQVISQ